MTRQEILDYAHGVVDLYEDIWTRHSHIAGAHRHSGTFFHLSTYAQSFDVEELYSAIIFKYPEQSGLRVLIRGYPTVPEPIAGVRQGLIGGREMLEDRFYPSLRLGNMVASNNSEDVGGESGSTQASSESAEEEE